MSALGKQVGLLVIIIVILVVVVALFGANSGAPTQNPTTVSGTLPTPVPPTQAQLDQLRNSTPFQYLVSYTNKGFEPNNLSVKKGETINFTNNSSKDLWIASIGTQVNKIYPGPSSCGSTAFDSCQNLKPGDFWEFTFTQSGTWSFQNNVDTSDQGVVTVQ